MKTISELWESRDQTEWLAAHCDYYKNPSVRRNPELEMRMSKLDPEKIKNFDEREWYAFLKDEYFVWKFTGNYLPQKQDFLSGYEKANKLGYLLSVKKRLFACDVAKYSGIAKALEVIQEIKGLGPAGASGLLALLYPQWVGTADKMVVKALREISSLPERQKLLGMMNGKDTGSLTDDDALLLINIMRKKAAALNILFSTNAWTPRRVDMILWDYGSNHGDRVRC